MNDISEEKSKLYDANSQESDECNSINLTDDEVKQDQNKFVKSQHNVPPICSKLEPTLEIPDFLEDTSLISPLVELAITFGKNENLISSMNYSYEILETYIRYSLQKIKDSNFNQGQGIFTPMELESEVINQFNIPTELGISIRKARSLRDEVIHLNKTTGKRNVDMGDITYIKYLRSIIQTIKDIETCKKELDISQLFFYFIVYRSLIGLRYVKSVCILEYGQADFSFICQNHIT